MELKRRSSIRLWGKNSVFFMKIISVVGARPNFMKISPFAKAIEAYNLSCENDKIVHVLVHTGQHYDDRMSDSFFKGLGIPQADINLGVGSGSHAFQVGNTMIEFEKIVQSERPDWIVVVGDVNATLACSITAKKEQVKCCHIEAGLRSGDISMPEEINRLVTDRLSDLLLTPDRISVQNLKNESVPESRIRFVGNIMIDTLEANRKAAAKLDVFGIINENLLEEYKTRRTAGNFKTRKLEYVLLTMHRPSNVDKKDILEPLFNFICEEVALDLAVIWPVHPRTLDKLKEFGLWEKAIRNPNLFLLYPIGYHEMLRLNMDAKIMFTDSGGLQEECCVLGTPCLTLRWNTERPVTLEENGGLSVLVGNDVALIRKEFYKSLVLERKPYRPELWDGNTAKRCLDAIISFTNCL